MSRYRSPYTGVFVTEAQHRRQVRAAEDRKERWEGEVRRAGAAVDRSKRPTTVAKYQRQLAEALYREYHALTDLSTLYEQEDDEVDVDTMLRQEVEVDRGFRDLARDYEDYDIPFEGDQDELFDESEGDEFEIRVESEGDTGE